MKEIGACLVLLTLYTSAGCGERKEAASTSTSSSPATVSITNSAPADYLQAAVRARISTSTARADASSADASVRQAMRKLLVEAEAHDTAGATLLEKDRYAEALAEFTAATSLYDRVAHGRTQLDSFFTLQRTVEFARQTPEFAGTPEELVKPRSLVEEATRHFAAGDFDKAMEEMQEAVDAYGEIQMNILVDDKSHEKLDKALVIKLGESVILEMLLVRPGSATLEASPGQPRRNLAVRKPFYLGKYEVTQEQWMAVMTSNPSRYTGPKNPVDSLELEKVDAFLKSLNDRISGRRFRLPTESQWEYACRAGTTGKFSFGNDTEQVGEYAWAAEIGPDKTSHPVGQKKCNSWGFFDMHGNVWELCRLGLDGQGQEAISQPNVVLRGGAFNTESFHCESGYRVLGSGLVAMGFRIVAD